MKKEGKFGTQEAVCLVTVTISSKVFFSSPATLVTLVGGAGWYMTLISALLGAVGFAFIVRLLRRFPGREITKIFELSLGPVLGFIFSGLLSASFLIAGAFRLAEFSNVMKIYILPLSPNWFITGIAAVCALVAGYLGLETIARFSKLAMYLLILGLLIVFILGFQNYDVNNLYPILGYGLGPTIRHGIIRSSVYGDVILLAVFAESLYNAKSIKKEGYLALLISALIISLTLFCHTLTFPYFTAMEVAAPMYQLATLIDYGRFFQRLEAIFVFFWVMTTLLSITVAFYASVVIYCRMFRIQDKNPIVLAGFVCLYTIALIPQNIAEVITGGIQFIRSVGAIPSFVLPLIALIAAKLRKKGVTTDA